MWYEKNGPHDKNSWEIHLVHPSALGGAITFLMLDAKERRRLLDMLPTFPNPKKEEEQETAITGPSSASTGRLYHPFHCRTYDGDNEMNEYNDHAFRFAWVGPVDPQPLDIDFFLRHIHK